MAIDDEIDDVLQDESPQGRTVKSLIEVKDRTEISPTKGGGFKWLNV